MSTTSPVTFEAPLLDINNWHIVLLPKPASQQLPSRGMTMVKGTLNGISFQSPLEPDGRWSHWLHVTDSLRRAANIEAGDIVQVAIEPTKEWPEPTVPQDVAAALAADPVAGPVWNDITPMARWDWLRWINSTTVAATRQRRIEVTCSKLRDGKRRPCCFNRSACCEPAVSKNGQLLQLEPA